MPFSQFIIRVDVSVYLVCLCMYLCFVAFNSYVYLVLYKKGFFLAFVNYHEDAEHL
jgi:hypothetical protein